MSTANLQQRVQDLLNHIRQGKIIEAMNEFYDRDAVMQDKANPSTKGLAANIEREKQFMSGVKEWKGFEVKASAAGDNVTFCECNMDFSATNAGRFIWSRCRWRSGRTARSSTSGFTMTPARASKVRRAEVQQLPTN